MRVCQDVPIICLDGSVLSVTTDSFVHDEVIGVTQSVLVTVDGDQGLCVQPAHIGWCVELYYSR